MSESQLAHYPCCITWHECVAHVYYILGWHQSNPPSQRNPNSTEQRFALVHLTHGRGDSPTVTKEEYILELYSIVSTSRSHEKINKRNKEKTKKDKNNIRKRVSTSSLTFATTVTRTRNNIFHYSHRFTILSRKKRKKKHQSIKILYDREGTWWEKKST